ncbi:hypothetical protein EVAR_39370_1 [Eumeta japonica]|uniref:Uncharacterized protein n=1 Tax=Eumeta variegata TaxID=151549 RepID=A0A4C1ZC82_EUMVA|nr:hypothetical protein EVAR_39370_1 [Eumeta japonica]
MEPKSVSRAKPKSETKLRTRLELRTEKGIRIEIETVRDLITKSGLMHWTRVGTDPANFDLKEVSRRDKPPATAASDLHLRRRGA